MRPPLENRNDFVGTRIIKLISVIHGFGLVRLEGIDGDVCLSDKANAFLRAYPDEILKQLSIEDRLEGILVLTSDYFFEDAPNHCGLKLIDITVIEPEHIIPPFPSDRNENYVSNFWLRYGWLLALVAALLITMMMNCCTSEETVSKKEIEKKEKQIGRHYGRYDEDRYISGMHYVLFSTEYGEVVSARNVTLDSLTLLDFKREQSYRNSGNVILK